MKSAVPEIKLVPYQSGFATMPFKASLPQGDSITCGRMKLRLSDGQSVSLVAHDSTIVVAGSGATVSTQEHQPGLSEGQLRLYARNGEARERLMLMLPVFRLNPERKHVDDLNHVWFAPQARFVTKEGDGALMQNAANIGGLIQDVALMGREATWDGARVFLDELRGPATYENPLGHEVDKLHYLFTEGVAPEYGELAHLVLGFAHAVSTKTIFPPDYEVSLEKVYAAAEQAMQYFDVHTVVRAMVVSGLAAAAREFRMATFQRLAKGFNDDVADLLRGKAFPISSYDRAEHLMRVAEKVVKFSSTFGVVDAGLFTLAGVAYLDAAHKTTLPSLWGTSFSGAEGAFMAAQRALAERPSNPLTQGMRDYAGYQVGLLTNRSS